MPIERQAKKRSIKLINVLPATGGNTLEKKKQGRTGFFMDSYIEVQIEVERM